MWKIDRIEFVDAVKVMEDMENQLNVLMNNFGSKIMDTITIDSPEFKTERYNLDLIVIENQIVRLRELIEQYIKEEDEYYENNEEG